MNNLCLSLCERERNIIIMCLPIHPLCSMPMVSLTAFLKPANVQWKWFFGPNCLLLHEQELKLTWDCKKKGERDIGKQNLRGGGGVGWSGPRRPGSPWPCSPSVKSHDSSLLTVTFTRSACTTTNMNRQQQKQSYLTSRCDENPRAYSLWGKDPHKLKEILSRMRATSCSKRMDY